MNVRLLCLTAALICQPALAAPPTLADTGLAIAAQSAAAAARIQADQLRELNRAPSRFALPHPLHAPPAAPASLPDMDAPVAFAPTQTATSREIMH